MNMSRAVTWLLGLGVFSSCIYMGNEDASKTAAEIGQWPQELSATKNAYCTLGTYQLCTKGQWFGVVRFAPLDRSSPPASKAYNAILEAVCLKVSDLPNTAYIRFIDQGNEKTLVLCRMKDPKQIDRGDMLKYGEYTEFYRRM